MTSSLIERLDWLPEHERGFYASVVHGLRSRGWSRIEAEDEALDRLIALRSKTSTNG